ncbi:hypothetical protein Asppvi_005238 [Aspergillus pseudoviridinutans]|uniref:Uncharacterized protein n=1 Tax=Aspergillus pseudoviridinutans TaxID=1517512 RepID=A0A9P3EV19_9EURO|nr:uncharacterized protein Asppvi_005238 [Aspergillus pseudoviridinutans]GIJ86350.1 hypothetical protein Asppvi_005238 [Aspergillus pseudoviridinutans]
MLQCIAMYELNSVFDCGIPSACVAATGVRGRQNDHELRRREDSASIDDGDMRNRQEQSDTHLSASVTFCFPPSCSRWYNYARNGTMRPSLAVLGTLLFQMVFNDMIRATAMKTTAATAFRLFGLGAGGRGHILLGQSIAVQPDAGAHDSDTPREAWGLKSGLYTPRQLVEAFAPLLDTVVFRLGPDPPNVRPARAQLLDNLAANLDTNTREATLRFPDANLDDSREEIAEQAKRIGRTLVQYARNHTDGPVNPDLYLRSPCEGHLLIPANVDLMFGRRSQPHLMQLFNEYMHQMVLLRDALLPFKNYEDVIIPVDGRAARGIRHLESSRAEFLTNLLTKEVTQSAIIKHAQALLAPGLLSRSAGKKANPGYGFQYAHGLVLPAFLAGGPTPFHLLQYLPAKLVHDATDVIFDYRIQDYYLAPRVEIPAGTEETPAYAAANGGTAALGVLSTSIAATSSSDMVRQLELQLQLDNGQCVSVDLGQVARGHRYAYQACTSNGSDSKSATSATSTVVHDAASILETGNGDSLVTAHGGLHVIPVHDPVVALALLGKIYPGNVILLPRSESLAQAEKAGKGLEPKFVLWGVERGGLRGRFTSPASVLVADLQ